MFVILSYKIIAKVFFEGRFVAFGFERTYCFIAKYLFLSP